MTGSGPARPEIRDFIERVCPGARVEALAGDASTRRFFRVESPGAPSRVLMDYGRPFEGEPDDVVLARILGGADLPVARVIEVDGGAGCLLLEDLGDRTLQAALDELGAAGRPLLERAVRLAAEIARAGTPALARSKRAAGPALDAERFRFEMDFFLEHFVRGWLARGHLPPGLAPALQELAVAAAGSPRSVLCHRDFHSRNLLLRDDGSLAMVDIQDARWGPDTYDLASLLRDAYVEIHESWIDPLVDLYGECSGVAVSEEFRRRFDVVSCQRMIKALGTFGYLRNSPQADRYLGVVPRTVARLVRLLPLREETRALSALLREAGVGVRSDPA